MFFGVGLSAGRATEKAWVFVGAKPLVAVGALAQIMFVAQRQGWRVVSQITFVVENAEGRAQFVVAARARERE